MSSDDLSGIGERITTTGLLQGTDPTFVDL
jgi:hypothetical protein